VIRQRREASESLTRVLAPRLDRKRGRADYGVPESTDALHSHHVGEADFVGHGSHLAHVGLAVGGKHVMIWLERRAQHMAQITQWSAEREGSQVKVCYLDLCMLMTNAQAKKFGETLISLGGGTVTNASKTATAASPGGKPRGSKSAKKKGMKGGKGC
jgi:hypothetical protein